MTILPSDEIKDVAKRAVGMFTEGEYDEVYLYYNHFVSAISSEVTEKKLLPLTDHHIGIGNDFL